MGRNTQGRQTNSVSLTNEKTHHQSFKWGRMLNALDYHRWHYVKKVLSHKKHHDEKFIPDIESDSNSRNCGNSQLHRMENTENSQTDVGKIDQYSHDNNSPLPTCPKSSRATKIKRMIAKEISKRKSRHRRSSTCPGNSELENASDADQHAESKNKEVNDETKEAKFSEQHNEGYNLFDPYSTIKIESQIEGEKQVENHNDQQSNEIHSLQQHPKVTIKQLPLEGKVKRSASFHNTEYYHIEVLYLHNDSIGFNKQQPNLNAKKGLTKSCTFSVNYGSSAKDYSYNNKDSRLRLTMFENPNNSGNSEIKKRTFKDLRHKIKHLVKENRKERRRIAMDAVLHKVPYGHKTSKERAKECPNVVDIIEKDSCISLKKTKHRKAHKRSPSLDESLDKYCQLYNKTNSFSKEAKQNNNKEISILRVTDVDTSMSKKKGLGRIFSSPDLQVFLSNKIEDYDGHISSTTPKRKIMSFSEKKVDDTLNIVEESGNQISINKDISHHELKECFDAHNKEALSSPVDIKSHTKDYFNDHHGIQFPQPTLTTEVEVILLKDFKGEQSQDFSNESPYSPTISCVKVGEQGVQNSILYVSPSLHHIEVAGDEREEFNYVREILQLSGYLGARFLGEWYSFDQPIDPSIFVNIESSSLMESKCSPLKGGNHNYRLLIYDTINEVLLAIYDRSMSYWSTPLCSCSRTHPMPKGYHVLIEVWNYITWYMSCSRPELESSLDYICTRDLAKDDSWMNLQLDAECVGLEVEELIFDDLLLEIIS